MYQEQVTTYHNKDKWGVKDHKINKVRYVLYIQCDYDMYIITIGEIVCIVVYIFICICAYVDIFVMIVEGGWFIHTVIHTYICTYEFQVSAGGRFVLCTYVIRDVSESLEYLLLTYAYIYLSITYNIHRPYDTSIVHICIYFIVQSNIIHTEYISYIHR